MKILTRIVTIIMVLSIVTIIFCPLIWATESLHRALKVFFIALSIILGCKIYYKILFKFYNK